MELTVMTYNIQSGRDLNRRLDTGFAAEVIRAHDPDIVALNEVRVGTRDVAGAHQARDLGEATGRNWAFGRAIDVEGGEYGNALLCRGEVTKSEVAHIPDPEIDRRGESFEHRCVLRCETLVGGARIAVCVSHFGLSVPERENAVRAARELLIREKLPVLFMGDLNMTPDDPLARSLRETIRDALDGALTPYTYPSDKPYERIDYLFASPEFTVLDAFCPDTQASDHRPLVARLRL